VDDDTASRMVLKEYSKTWGCICEEAANKKRAMEKLESSGLHPFDVALIHMQLEKTEGEALATKIRNIPDHSGLILILLYSVGEKGDVERLQSIGVEGYLPKPVDAELLFDCITMSMAMKQDGAHGVVTQHLLKENRKKQYPILLFEPGRVNRNLARNILIRSGYTVEVVENENQALAAFETGRFHLVLAGTAADEPGPDEFITRIRSIEKQKGFEKAALLVMAECTGDIETAAKGADECIAKPLNTDHLLAAIERHTCRKQSHSALNGRGADKNLIFNHVPALERAMGDREFLEMVVHEFVNALPEKIRVIKSNFEKKDMAGLVQKVHSLRGSASTIGADAVSAAALELEKAGDVGDMETFFKKIQRLEDEFQRFVAHVDTMDWSNL